MGMYRNIAAIAMIMAQGGSVFGADQYLAMRPIGSAEMMEVGMSRRAGVWERFQRLVMM